MPTVDNKDVRAGHHFALLLGTHSRSGARLTVPAATFPPILDLPGQAIQQTFTWDMTDLPAGTYGPVLQHKSSK